MFSVFLGIRMALLNARVPLASIYPVMESNALITTNANKLACVPMEFALI